MNKNEFTNPGLRWLFSSRSGLPYVSWFIGVRPANVILMVCPKQPLACVNTAIGLCILWYLVDCFHTLHRPDPHSIWFVLVQCYCMNTTDFANRDLKFTELSFSLSTTVGLLLFFLNVWTAKECQEIAWIAASSHNSWVWGCMPRTKNPTYKESHHISQICRGLGLGTKRPLSWDWIESFKFSPVSPMFGLLGRYHIAKLPGSHVYFISLDK